MRNFTFLLVFLFILLIYSLANYYLYLRGVQAFQLAQPIKRWITIGYILLSYSFFAGMILERIASTAFSEWVYRIGTFWLPFMLYLLMAVLLIDLIRLADYFLHFLPHLTRTLKLSTGIVVVSVVALIVVAGYVNALNVRVKNIPLKIDKEVDGQQRIRVLMASDLHLGALIGERRERQFLRIVQQQKPDLVLLCGDLLDGEIAPVLRKKLGSHIQEIDAPMGVYAITGNHEYIGGISKSLAYLRSVGINVLIDTLVALPNGIQLVGRNDRAAMHGNQGQKPLAGLLVNADHSKPIIVMNHQPYHLEEASEAGADLHLSGHTHHGQLWPFGYITKAIFELSWGYLKKGTTHFYVSTGFGTWGPTVRLGNHPEVIVFDLQFNSKNHE